MHFDTRDIRLGMDVFTADNVYLGSVVRLPAAENLQEDAYRAVDPSSRTSGEALGPSPTVSLGNTGPLNQSARTHYATQPDANGVFPSGSFEVGKWFGLVGRKSIPVAFVQSLSAERIVLRRSDVLDD